MNKEISIGKSWDFQSLTLNNGVVSITLGSNFLFDLINLSVSNQLIELFDCISKNDKIRILVIKNSPGKVDCKGYIEFCRNVISTESDRKSIHRMCNSFDRLILAVAGLKKIVVYADSGEIIPLFLNLSLACDYRIFATNSVFRKPYFELEMLPKGGGAFFLCNMLGYPKAARLLMSDDDISAEDAFTLGIVDQLVPYEELEEKTIKMVRSIAQKPYRCLSGLKQLINYSMRDLKDYLVFENSELLKTIGFF